MSEFTTEVQHNYEDCDIYSVNITEDRLGSKYMEIQTHNGGMYYLTEKELMKIVECFKGDLK